MIETFVADVTCVPPLASVNQPSNLYVYPASVRVDVGKSPYVESYVTVFDVGDTLPPFASNATVYSFAVQCA